jgi:hypothetical protein
LFYEAVHPIRSFWFNDFFEYKKRTWPYVIKLKRVYVGFFWFCKSKGKKIRQQYSRRQGTEAIQSIDYC